MQLETLDLDQFEDIQTATVVLKNPATGAIKLDLFTRRVFGSDYVDRGGRRRARGGVFQCDSSCLYVLELVEV